MNVRRPGFSLYFVLLAIGFVGWWYEEILELKRLNQYPDPWSGLEGGCTIEVFKQLIADEVEKVNQDLCFYDYGKLSGVHYDRMIAPLIKALQEQKAEIDALKARVTTLESS